MYTAIKKNVIILTIFPKKLPNIVAFTADLYHDFSSH